MYITNLILIRFIFRLSQVISLLAVLLFITPAITLAGNDGPLSNPPPSLHSGIETANGQAHGEVVVDDTHPLLKAQEMQYAA